MSWNGTNAGDFGPLRTSAGYTGSVTCKAVQVTRDLVVAPLDIEEDVVVPYFSEQDVRDLDGSWLWL